MAFVLNDRVKETSTTSGTGTFTLDGATTGFETFSSAIGNANTTYYCIHTQNAEEFEVGIGTVGAGTLARDTVISSTNSDAAVDFSTSTTKDVFCTMPASKVAYKNDSGASVNSVSYKLGGTDFDGSLLVGTTTTGTLNDALRNTGVGTDTLDALTSGDFNTAVGNLAGTSISSGGSNTCIGKNSGYNLEIGSGNTFLGVDSGKAVTGSNNICIGHEAGEALSSGAGNVLIGQGIEAASNTGSQQLKIAGNNDSSTVTWIEGDSSGNLTVEGTVTADSQLLVGAGFAIAMSIAL